ncbi:MAG: ribonuclease P protein component [Pseudomonadota bacterium]
MDGAAPEGEPARGERDPAGTPETLKKRRDFLAAARARRWAAPGLLLQGRRRREGEPAPAEAVRVGYTCSKKVGNAVARNRAKRRLRAAAAAVLPRVGRPGWDYVLIGRAEATAARPFADLLGDLETALARVHQPQKRKPGGKA